MTNRTFSISVGVSSCLLGERVRYDGDHQFSEAVASLAERFTLVPFCPEMAIGLGVPRPKIQLKRTSLGVICVDMDTQTRDYTDALRQCARRHWQSNAQLCGYVFKTKSPSCGLTQVKTDIDGEIVPVGTGIFAAEWASLAPGLPCIEEHTLLQPGRQAAFIDAVRQYAAQLSIR